MKFNIIQLRQIGKVVGLLDKLVGMFDSQPLGNDRYEVSWYVNVDILVSHSAWTCILSSFVVYSVFHINCMIIWLCDFLQGVWLCCRLQTKLHISCGFS